jgi:hypothetical protein
MTTTLLIDFGSISESKPRSEFAEESRDEPGGLVSRRFFNRMPRDLRER